MQVKNSNPSFKPVTVTFDTDAEYQAFREILYTSNNLSFEGKAGEVFETLYDEFDVNSYED